MSGDPLARGEAPGLGGGPGHVGQAASPAVAVGDVVLGAVAALSSGPGELIRRLVARDAVVVGDPYFLCSRARYVSLKEYMGRYTHVFIYGAGGLKPGSRLAI